MSNAKVTHASTPAKITWMSVTESGAEAPPDMPGIGGISIGGRFSGWVSLEGDTNVGGFALDQAPTTSGSGSDDTLCVREDGASCDAYISESDEDEDGVVGRMPERRRACARYRFLITFISLAYDRSVSASSVST